MSEESQRKKRRLIVGILLFLLLTTIAVSMLFFRSVIRSELDNSTQLASDSLANQLQVIINMDFLSAKNSVIRLAESVTTLGHDESTILQYLRNQMGMHSFINIFFVDINGNGITPSNRTKDFSSTVHLTSPKKNQVTTSIPYNDDETNNIIMELSAPVYDNDIFKGLIIAEYSFIPLKQQLINAIGNSGYMLIADGKGVPVFSTIENYLTLTMLNNNQIKNNVTLESVVERIQHREEGIFSFTFESQTWLALYKPLDVYNWYIVLLLDDEAINGAGNLVVNIITSISIILFTLLTILIWYTLHSKIKSIEKIEKVAYYDDLTGLPNITKFKMHVQEMLDKYPSKQFAMIRNDIVSFKAINEMYGYEMGNEVLKAFAATATLASEKTFMLARVDADKFIFFSGGGFLENLDTMTSFYEEYFKKAVPRLANHHLEFTYGRYIIKPGENDVNDIINKTTIAHSIAKKNRANSHGSSIWDYSDDYTKEILLQTHITNKMKQALENNEFMLYLQTKVNTKSEKVVGAEALVRWIESDGSTIYPNIFIPLFEKNGFVENIDMYILHKVCQVIRGWIDNKCQCVPISVNFSRLHLKNPNFVDMVIKTVDSFNIPHNLIEIELTESTVIDNETMLEKLLEDFYTAGFLVSIDDFGAGYSSLGLLKSFKLHTIKLDRSFFLDDDHERAELVVEGIIKLAHTLDIKVVAEGIEEKRQIQFLRKVKCETIQGYYFDKPIPSEIFTKKYMRKQ